MIIRQAFLLNYYNILDGQLSFAGRVLSEIKINDILLYKNEDVETKYLVKKILAYRNEFNVIDIGMTCELIVQGDLRNFQEDSILCIVDSNI